VIEQSRYKSEQVVIFTSCFMSLQLLDKCFSASSSSKCFSAGHRWTNFTNHV